MGVRGTVFWGRKQCLQHLAAFQATGLLAFCQTRHVCVWDQIVDEEMNLLFRLLSGMSGGMAPKLGKQKSPHQSWQKQREGHAALILHCSFTCTSEVGNVYISSF